MNFKEVLLIVNPIAGDINKKKIISKFKDKVKSSNANFHLFTTTGENDSEKIKSRLRDGKIDRVVVAGGDGTINLVADAVKEMDIILGIIPAGSANGLAVNFDIPDDLEEQISIALGNTFIDLDLLCINDNICLHMSDLGINAELVKNYENSSIRGKFGYLLQSIPTLIKSEFPFDFHIETGKDQKTATAVLLGFANMQKYGTGANVNPHGKPNDGVFEILIFKRLSLSEILKTLRNEADLDPEFVEILQASEAVITCKKPVAFQVDGEYLGMETKIDIRILDKKIKMAIP